MVKTLAGLCGLLLASGTAAAGTPPPQHAHQAHRPSSAQLLAAERTAMAPLAMMDGVWRGSATVTMRGTKHTITQTERVGPFLQGTVKVMEGRGYDADGSLSFNALGIISYQPASKTWSMHSYARGYAGDFPLKLTKDGFSWSIPAGPTTMRYTATIKDGTWHEVGDRIMPGKKPVRFFEMTLKRVGDSDWPAAGAVPFKPAG